MFHGLVLCLLTCCCWGSTSVCLRGLKKEIDSYDMCLLRAFGCFVAAAVFAYFFSSVSRLLAVPAGVLMLFLPMVFLNNILGDIFLFLALRSLGVARGASIASTYPVVVAVASAIFFGEQLTMTVAAGTLIVIAGVMCLCQKGAEAVKMPVSAKGVACAVLAALFWGVGIMFTKDLIAHGLTPDEVTFGRSVVFIIFALALWFVKLARLGADERKKFYGVFFSLSSWLGVLAGFLSLGCGTWFYSSAIEYIPMSVATPICASNPMLATIAAYFMFGEKLTPVQWVGVALTIAGSVIVAL